MEQETLVTKLTEVVGNTNLSSRSISEYAKSIMPLITSDEQVDDTFLETHGNILKTIAGQLRHDLADGIENFKKNYKPEPPKPNTPPTEKNEELETLKAQFEELKNALKTKEEQEAKNVTKEKVVSALKAKIKEATGADPNSFVFKATVRDIVIGENADIDTLVKDAQKSYDENLKDAGIETATPRYPSNGGGSGKNTALDNFFAAKKAKENWGKK